VRRLIAEGVVIVASILLAFGLDAWWDATQQSRETADLLVALDEEFALAAEELDGTLFGHQSVVTSADTILGRLRAGQGRVPAGRLYWVLDAPTSDLNQGTLAALIASGGLEQVPSQELRTLLAAWPAAVGDFQEEEAEARVFVRAELMPYLSEVAEIGTALRAGRLNLPDSTGVVAVPTSSRLINLIEIRRFLAQRVITERGQAQIDQRLDQIRRELQTHMR
jgi:hypothetical protein